MDSVLKTVQEILCQQYELSEAQVAPDQKLKNLGLDSLTQIEFVYKLEERFGISMPDAPSSITTVADVVRVVEETLAAKKG